MKKTDLNEIKNIIESISGYKKIQTRSRKRHYTYIRYVYCKVALMTNRYNLSQIGRPIHRDHSTVIHALNQFDQHTGKSYFEFYDEVYNECLSILGIKKNKLEIEKQDYRLRFLSYCASQKQLVNQLKRKLDAFRYKKLIHDLALLDDKDYQEAQERIRAFLLMNRIKSKYNFKSIE
jgi:hypothetical protein